MEAIPPLAPPAPAVAQAVLTTGAGTQTAADANTRENLSTMNSAAVSANFANLEKALQAAAVLPPGFLQQQMSLLLLPGQSFLNMGQSNSQASSSSAGAGKSGTAPAQFSWEQAALLNPLLFQ